jgi:hypothetical protein
VKSGRAVFILIEGSIRVPRLRQSGVINLSDPRNPETQQPYHAAMGKLEMNAAVLKRRVQSVRAATERSVTDLIRRCAESGYVIHRAALVVGSVIDPDSIANPHIRAHALDACFGQFWRVLCNRVEFNAPFSLSGMCIQAHQNFFSNRLLKYAARSPISELSRPGHGAQIKSWRL